MVISILNNHTKVSVVISTYNKPKYLYRVIEGYLNQTRLPGEIIVADDGSQAATANLIQELQRNAPIKIIHIWHEDKGFRAAKIRNKAIAKSSGDYLILSDDDSVPSPTLVSDHIKYQEPGCFIQGHRVLLGPRASESFTFKNLSLPKLIILSAKGQAKNIVNAVPSPLPLIKKSQQMHGIRSCNLSFFKQDFLDINGFNEDFEGWGKEDSELVARFYKYGLKRKDIKFRAYCYHLYHAPYSRDNLKKNIALLEQAQQGNEFFCKNGIDKYLEGNTISDKDKRTDIVT